MNGKIFLDAEEATAMRDMLQAAIGYARRAGMGEEIDFSIEIFEDSGYKVEVGEEHQEEDGKTVTQHETVLMLYFDWAGTFLRGSRKYSLLRSSEVEPFVDGHGTRYTPSTSYTSPITG